MNSLQSQVAQLERAAQTAKPESERKVEVALNESASQLPAHIIASTDPVKLNRQASIFRCPAWAGLPPRQHHLYCLRDKVIFPSLELNRFPYYLFGKNPVCDYVLEHPSVSSVHAALIFHQPQGCYVLLDLGSTNGVRLQGKRVEVRKPIPISVGATLQFGYSSRTYELRIGPPPPSSSTTVGPGKRLRGEGGEEKDDVPSARIEGSHSTTINGAATSHSSTPIPVGQQSGVGVGVGLSTSHVDNATEGYRRPVDETALSSQAAPDDRATANRATPVTSSDAAGVVTPRAIHLFQLVIKHKDVENPVSRGRNKGEVITRSRQDALEMVKFIVDQHAQEVRRVYAETSATPFPKGSVRWTAEEFAAAVMEYCEVSNKKKRGDLGMVEQGVFSDEIDHAAFLLQPGEVSAPVETQLGIHLLYRCD